MSVMELYDLYAHEDKSPCRFTVQPRTLSATLSRCPRPCRAVTLSSALHAQTAVERAVSRCERFYAVPRVLPYPSPRTRPERPRNAPVSLPTRAHAPAYARPLCVHAHCSNLHNVDRPTLCKALKVLKVRKKHLQNHLDSSTL